jgi:hypothetical protein
MDLLYKEIVIYGWPFFIYRTTNIIVHERKKEGDRCREKEKERCRKTRELYV